MIRLHLLLLALALLGACADRSPGTGGEPVEHRPEPVEPRGDGPAIEYTVRFPAAHTHYLEVEAVYPAEGDTVELMMAVWTPGSYLVREFSRHVEGLTASTVDGELLPLRKVAKNRWVVEAGGADRVVARYRLYCREPTVRTNFVDADQAILNGAPTFITVDGATGAAHDVAFELPDGWQRVITALPPHPDGGDNRFLAADYDTLVDSPVIIGDAAVYELEPGIEGAGDAPHYLANLGEGGLFDGAKAAEDLSAMVAEHVRFWGVVPYQHYWFLNALLGAGTGGLEHKDSTLMLASPWATRRRADYLRWLGLASHEFFHTWNIKRLRPEALGPFDYEREVYTPSLWVAEGITSYYDDLLLHRADLMSRDEYLKLLSDQIAAVQRGPGRAVQSLSAASFDAWIKYYRPDENSGNTSVSYYRKGAVVAFLLDAEVRRASYARHSLDDVMRLAYERYSGERGYTPEQFRRVVAEVAGQPLDDFFARYVDGTEELDYTPALDYFGLRFAGGADDDDGDDGDETPGWLGVSLSGAVIKSINRDTPAYDAGLNAGDEILAIDDYRVAPGELGARLERYRPGDEVTVLVARYGRLRRVPVTLGREPTTAWKLEVRPDANSAQRARLAAWLDP